MSSHSNKPKTTNLEEAVTEETRREETPNEESLKQELEQADAPANEAEAGLEPESTLEPDPESESESEPDPASSPEPVAEVSEPQPAPAPDNEGANEPALAAGDDGAEPDPSNAHPIDEPEPAEAADEAPTDEPEAAATDDESPADEPEPTAGDVVPATDEPEGAAGDVAPDADVAPADEPEPVAPTGATPAPGAAKRKVAAIVLALIAVLCTLQALSFVVRDHTEPGRMSFDGVDIELQITTHDAAGAEVPAKDMDEIPVGLVPVDRTVYAKNTGHQRVWVRVDLDFAMQVNNETVDISEFTAFDRNEAQWIERDGWFYLTEPLDPGQVSPPLITGLTVDSQQAIARHGEGTYQLTARAGAVQSKHNATTALEVEGWPE